MKSETAPLGQAATHAPQPIQAAASSARSAASRATGNALPSGALPQGRPEHARRVRAMVDAADREGFGGCTLHGECQAACPKGIDLSVIARMNRDYLTSCLTQWWTRTATRGSHPAVKCAPSVRPVTTVNHTPREELP